MAEKGDEGKPLEQVIEKPRSPEPQKQQSSLPEGGWGWVIVAASFMIMVVGGGTGNSLSVFITAITNDYGEYASWVGSLFLAVSFGTGPFAGALVNQFGCRRVAFAGITIMVIGITASCWAINLIFLCFSAGIFSGIGLGLTYLPALVILSFWFEKRRSFVTGLALSGAGIGTLVLAPVYKITVEKLGWRYSLLLVSGVLVTLYGGVAVYRLPPQNPAKAANTAAAPQEPSTGGDASRISIGKKRPASSLLSIANSYSAISREHTADADQMPEEITTTSTTHVAEAEQGDKNDVEASASRPGSVVVPQERSCRNSGFVRVVLAIFDTALLSNPVFVYFAAAHFLASLGENVPFILLDKVVTANMHAELGGYVVGAAGISGTLSRLCLGYLCDKKWVDRIVLFSAAAILAGIAIGLTSHSYQIGTLFACAIVFGICNGVYAFLTPVILVDLFGLHKLNSAFGITLLFQGAGTLFGSPIVEALYQKTGGYVWGCWFAGAITMVAGVMFFFVRYMGRVAALVKRRSTGERTSVANEPSSSQDKRQSSAS